jgi:hypothetical protein
MANRRQLFSPLLLISPAPLLPCSPAPHLPRSSSPLHPYSPTQDSGLSTQDSGIYESQQVRR